MSPLQVIAHELNQSLVSLRLANIYDLSSKILLLKFAKPDNKKQLVIDTGFRCHLTEFARTTAAAPSQFVARLRKTLKTRRLTSVAQVGTDRILEFQFSDGQYRMFLEFFAVKLTSDKSGNIILTDADLRIFTIARNVSEGDGQEPQRIGLQYSLDNRQNYHGIPPMTKGRVQEALELAVQKATVGTSSSKKLKGKPGGDLRKSLAVSITELPPVLVDHILQSNKFDTTVKPAEVLANEALLDELIRLLSEARKMVEDITSAPICTGYIFAKQRDDTSPSDSTADVEPKRESLLYEDFHPFVPRKLRDDPSIKVLEFEGYNQTVDEFFSSLEGQKLESRLNEREATAKRKLEAAKRDQEKRLEGLQEVQSMNFRKAAAIEANVERVQEAMDAVNGLLAQGMDWVDIGKLVEREKKKHNPVAEIIMLPLKLAENIITLKISEEEFEEEEEEDPFETDDSDSEDGDEGPAPSKTKATDKSLSVDINLTISPWSNAREYHDQRRSAASKEEKTQLQAARALKNTEQKITEDLKKGLKQEKALLQPIRKQMWFEKFIWFISSDGYLVIGGKDASQNEMLYRRYLRKGDVYCHADLRGAPSVIIKNNPSTPDAPIPPATLSQAGSLSVCASDAWDSKAGMGAWWVNADQVSKSAPTGEFLPTGSFMVRGKKNFLPPTQLLLGLGIMFKISEESKARHVKHRLHDADSAIGSGVEDSMLSLGAQESTAGDEGSEVGEDDGGASQEDGEEGSDNESANGDAAGTGRDNPLQGFESGRRGEVDEVEHQVTKLSVSDAAEARGSGAEDEEAASGEASRDDPEGQSELNTEVSETQTAGSAARSSQPANSTGSKQAPPKRGQKGKAKKIAAKYKDQDEDDRRVAEALIGATTGQKRAEEEARVKAERAAELEAAKERRRAQHQRAQKQTAEHEEIRRVMMDEGVDVLEPEEAEKVTSLDDLIGTPLAGDEIVEAIPVCAPWTALGKFKYKAKMQPGATKKGKAVKEVIEKWKSDSNKKGAVDESSRDSERMWPREVELLKALKPEEVINCVPVGKLRVMMAGGSSGGGGGKGKGGGGKGQGKSGRGGKGSKK
ncbi:1-phosphatidylinositol-4,5-bisphosphate phosphodiesterase 1 [Purpureocillium lavendulum]|uniref:Ribosome quality control complex subunit 2 n=1 Tax=Purpureocillium lavendulum TaxID=1247861 RepID=A0AB34FWV6_9HYPO|nr:1-phosphatidylinositol-4,5-bisphosphate phosphodiesterase 1 [Purpureocillium lavendulum]